MILEDFQYKTREDGEWLSLSLTQGELDAITEQLDSILVPCNNKYVRLELQLKFLPGVRIHTCRFNSRIWDCFNGWRN